MHLQRKTVEHPTIPEKRRMTILIVLAVAFGLMAFFASLKIINHATASTTAIQEILSRYSMQNEGARALERFDEKNPFLGFFISSPIRENLDLPSTAEANHALGTEVRHLLKTVRLESSAAAWWSWFLINMSLFYVILIMTLERKLNSHASIFALTASSLIFFLIGIFAPAMVVWTAPTVPMPTGNLEFVLQHQVRGIAAIIKELITTGHWVVGGFLLLFSIITPLTKALLTFYATSGRSARHNRFIGTLLHSIGKWSMADVFVAGVLLALYALKAQEATRSIPCLGLYYFMAYCVLSMSTTELLVHSELVVEHDREQSRIRLGRTAIAGLFAFLLLFLSATGAYTYEQYTLNTKQGIKSSTSLHKLDNADLVLPAHHK